MAEYKAIRGLTIQTVAGDPSPLQIGDIWYSSTTRKIRGAKLGAGAWATGGNMSTGRDALAGAGTQTAALVFGGRVPADSGVTESYDGSSWTEVADITAGHNMGGLGTQTAAMAIGRAPTTAITEIYNGTSWTEVEDLNTGRSGARGAGTITAGLAFGGAQPGVRDETEVWNGTAWTEVADLNESRGNAAGYGTSTAAHMVSGNAPPSTTVNTEIFDGTSWTEEANVNTAHYGLAGSGSTTAGMKFAGDTTPGKSGVTEEYDGSSWTEVADLTTARGQLAGAMASPSTTSLAMGGREPAKSVATEEWDKAVAASSFTSS